MHLLRRHLVALACFMSLGAFAQGLPTGKQVRIVDPYAAGGTSDILGRKLAQAESGIKDFDTGVWYGVYVAGKTPPAVVQMLNTEFVRILKSPDMVTWLREQGLEPIADSPDEAKNWLTKEIRTWKAVANAAGIKPE
ncbi:MAG TPA: tripartite tricarboxylate transporter substrate-binding protein [Hyphomicrobiaceae bacterium]|nr:tripartite tricarboxylate transporter substrate-binding protein [Hyphomicrobiaceae bacterium]